MPVKKTKTTTEVTPKTEEQNKEILTNHVKDFDSEPILRQTDTEPDKNAAACSNAQDTGKETAIMGSSDTKPESENDLNLVSEPEDHGQSGETSPVPKTDSETAENIAPTPYPDEESAEISDSKIPGEGKTKKGAPSKRMAATESDTDGTSDNKTNPDDIQNALKRTVSASRIRPGSIVSIDEQRSVEIDADRERNALLDLTESMKGQKLMTGTVQGIEHPAHEPMNSLAVTYHGDYKIIIPVKEFVEPPADLKGQQLETVLNYMMNKRMGAEIDYIVKGIDDEAKVAVASRIDAMHAKRKAYYFGSDRDGNNLLYSDLSAEARVVSVVRSGIFVDLFGLEVFISVKELSYQRVLSADNYFQPGQRILVKILEIDRKNRDNIKVRASVKQAGENPYEKALRKYTVGNRYVGTVSLVDTNGVFVSLDGGIDCLCNYPKRGRPPRGARVTVRILGINSNSNRIWGAITHIATAR